MAIRCLRTKVAGFFFAGALTIATATAAVAATAPTAQRRCDSSVLPDCKALSSAPLDARGQLGFGTPRDGGAIFNSQAYFSEPKTPAQRAQMQKTVKSLMTPSPARDKRATEVAEQMRARAISFLKANTPDSAERKILIERLGSLTIDTISNPPDTCSIEATLPGYPNLGYSSHTHTLYICTSATNVTEAQLIQGLTHELGHVVSPCQAQSKAYKVDSEQLFKGPLAECSASFFYDDEGNRLDSIDPTVATLMDYKPAQVIERAPNAALQSLSGCKIVSEVPNSSVPSAQIFSGTTSCLLGKFKTSLEKTDAFKLARTMGKTPAQAAAQLHAAGDDVCADDFEEAFADRFSSSMLAQVANEKSWTEKDWQAALLEKAGVACYETSSDKKFLMEKYELASTRIKALLNDPSTAARLRCESPKEPNLCPLQFSSRAPSRSEKTTAQPPAGSAGSRK